MSSLPRPGPNSPEKGAGQRSLDLFENAPVGLWEVDATGIIITINHTLLQWLGCAPAEVIDRQRIEALVSPESAATVRALAEQCRRAEPVAGVTLMWRSANEHRYWPGEVIATA